MIFDFSGLNFLFFRRGGVTGAVNRGASEHFVQKQMRVASGATVFILAVHSDIGEDSVLPHSMFRADGSWLTLALTAPRLVWGDRSKFSIPTRHIQMLDF